MKYTLLFSLLFCLFSSSAQNHFVGLKGGASWTNAKTDKFLLDLDTKIGINLGLSYDYMFKKYLALESGIMYNQLGFTNDIYVTNAESPEIVKDITTTYKYNYLTVPVKIAFNYGEKIYVFVALGATPSILVKANWIIPSIEFNDVSLEEQVIDNTNDVNRFDIGGLAEVGFGYKFKDRFWLYSAFSYQQSFTSITNSNYYDKSVIKNYGMNLNFGLKYALAKPKE